MLATLKLLAVYVGLGVPLGIVGIPWTLMTGDVTWMYWRAMGIVRLGLRAAGVRIEVTGIENVPMAGSCIFMSNHVSNLDPPVLLPLMPRRGVVLLKKELMSIPVLGRAMRLGGFIPVERGSQREAAKSTVAAAAKAVAEGLPILVFPEGTRSLNGRLGRFKKGPFFLAEQTGAPIVPVAIFGTQKLMAKGSAKITPGDVQVRMLRAIASSEFATREELMERVRGAIAAALPGEMR